MSEENEEYYNDNMEDEMMGEELNEYNICNLKT